MVQLTDELVQLLDREAVRAGVSRSAVIREAVVRYLTDSREADITGQIVDGYRRQPATTPDEWGSLDASTDLASRELLARLDAEERHGGHAPW